MDKKKEFTVKFSKNVNGSWCGCAYFVNNTLGQVYMVTCAASPQEKKVTASGKIKERLSEYEGLMQTRHPDWRRVNQDEYENFSNKDEEVMA